MVRINFRLFFRLVVVGLFFGGGLYGLYAYQSQRIPEAMLWHVNHSMEQGKTDEAMKYMRRYLELCPTDYDQTVKLADLMSARAVTAKDLTNALYLYEKIMREAPEHREANKKFIDVSLRLNRHAEALRVAEELVKALPLDGELRGQIAECLMAQNKFAEAKDHFEQAIKLDPTHVRSFEQYARLLTFKMNQPKEALAVLDQLVQQNPASKEAHLLRARARYTAKDLSNSMSDLDRVFWLDPENIEALLLASEIEQVRGNARRSRETLLALLDIAPRDVRGYRSLSWLNLLNGNPTEAVQVLERGLVRLPESADLMTPLGDLSLEQGDFDKAKEIIKKLEAKPAVASQGKYLTARLLMKQRKFKEAIAILEPLRVEVLNVAGVEQQVSMLLASCYERCGEIGQMRETLKRLISKDPNNLSARVAMANMLLDAGQLIDASREYDLAAKSPIAGNGVRLMAGKLRLKRMQADPKTANTEWNDLESQFREMIRQQPNSIEPVLLLAELQSAHGKMEAGIETLRAACRQRPSDPRLWVALMNQAANDFGSLRAIDILNESKLVIGETVEWKLARARLLVTNSESIKLEQLTGSMTTLSETEQIRFWQGLVEILQLTRFEEAKLAACRELAGISSQDLVSRRQMYLASVRQKDKEAENRWGEQIDKIIASGSNYRSLLKAIEETRTTKLSSDRLQELTSLSERLGKQTPEFVEAHWLAARLAEQAEDVASAASNYSIAQQMDPLNVELLADRAKFLASRSQSSAHEQFWSALTFDPRFSPARRSAVRRLADERDPALPKSNTDYWATELARSAGQDMNALQETITAAEQSLGRTKLLALLAANRSLLKKHAPAWKLDIRSSEEMRQFAIASVTHAEFTGVSDEAFTVLRALAQDPNAKPEDAEWAKQAERALCVQLGERAGIFPKSELAIWLEKQPKSISEHRSRVSALMLALRSSEITEREAILRGVLSSLGEVTKDNSATANDWHQLSQVYRGIGDRTNARRCLSELLKREPNNLHYLAINADELMSDGRLSEVEPLITTLQTGVHDLRVASVLAKYLAMVNDARGVLETTDQFVKAVDAGSADGTVRQRQAAELLDQLARISLSRNLSGAKILLEGACERYRAVSTQYPEAVAGWASLLALAGQPEKAFEELDQRQQRLSPTDLALAGMRVLRGNNASAKHYLLVQSWLTKALADQPKSLPLWLNQAEWHTLQNQYSHAGKAYQRVLAIDPNHMVALNNLAWIWAADSKTAVDALPLVEKAIQQVGPNPELQDTRGRILISLGRYPEAKTLLQQSLNASQTGVRYFHLALWHWKQDQVEDAIREFREATHRGLDVKAIHPDDVSTYRELLTRVK